MARDPGPRLPTWPFTYPFRDDLPELGLHRVDVRFEAHHLGLDAGVLALKFGDFRLEREQIFTGAGRVNRIGGSGTGLVGDSGGRRGGGSWLEGMLRKVAAVVGR